LHFIRRFHIRPGTAVLGAVLLLAALTALSAVGLPQTIDETTLFDLAGVREISLNAAEASVRVTRAPAGDTARVRLYGETAENARLEYRLEGDVLTVVVMREPALSLRPQRLTLDVSLPETYARGLTVDAGSGEVTLDALTLHTLCLYTASGNVTLRPLTVDTLTVKSVSGDIAAEAVTADTLRVDATSGTVDIAGLCARDAAVTATSADVRLCYAAFDGCALAVQNTSGGIRLTLPEGAAFGFDICRTRSDVRSDFAGIAAVCGRSGTLCGAVNGGGGSLNIDSVSGEIDILNRNAYAWLFDG
jgi:hypothetical protein